jgi:type IV secretion system protein TrbL
MDPNAIGGQFTAAAQAYANGIQPYAAKLFVALLFIEILVTAIQYMTDQGDAPRYIGRLFRHLFSAGFIYLMLINAFPWMTGVMKSFSAIGAAVSGVPNLSPSTVLDLGGQMAETIYNTPASTGMIPNFSMALGQTVAAFFILLSFTIIAALALLIVIEMYLVVGGASILLAFGGSRFTAPIAEDISATSSRLASVYSSFTWYSESA